jgi:predicted transcriptional regulator
MVITLGPELEAALNEVARRQGVAPDVLAVNALRERFLAAAALQPLDEWERGLLEAARDCGVSLPDSALSSEGLYD